VSKTDAAADEGDLLLIGGRTRTGAARLHEWSLRALTPGYASCYDTLRGAFSPTDTTAWTGLGTSGGDAARLSTYRACPSKDASVYGRIPTLLYYFRNFQPVTLWLLAINLTSGLCRGHHNGVN
jgi:hypothetical protein